MAPRKPTEGWSRQDLTTLADLARHTGAAVHATRLADELNQSLVDLQGSRQQLVATQEHERRRIQRDLHDGLGPILAAIRLHLEGCLQVRGDVPEHVREALERVDELVEQASADVRALVAGLHPPQLAQFGLPGVRLPSRGEPTDLEKDVTRDSPPTGRGVGAPRLPAEPEGQHRARADRAGEPPG